MATERRRAGTPSGLNGCCTTGRVGNVLLPSPPGTPPWIHQISGTTPRLSSCGASTAILWAVATRLAKVPVVAATGTPLLRVDGHGVTTWRDRAVAGDRHREIVLAAHTNVAVAAA